VTTNSGTDCPSRPWSGTAANRESAAVDSSIDARAWAEPDEPVAKHEPMAANGIARSASAAAPDSTRIPCATAATAACRSTHRFSEAELRTIRSG
jgi:hypothetical protein